MCRTYCILGEFHPSIWLNRFTTPPFYPNAVTLADAHNQDAQLVHICELIAARVPGAWAVKDSFAALDLASLGFTLLFEAMWICRQATAVRPTALSTDVRWERVGSAGELLAWEMAWRGTPAEPAAPALANLFRPALLADPDVLIVAAYYEQRIVAGAIANRTGAVVGLSNVFMPDQGAEALWAGCVGAILDHFPGQALVGYEAGQALAYAQACGFEVLQPLRVWEFGGRSREILDLDHAALERVDDDLRAISQTELVQHARHVGSDGRLAHIKRGGDLGVPSTAAVHVSASPHQYQPAGRASR